MSIWIITEYIFNFVMYSQHHLRARMLKSLASSMETSSILEIIDWLFGWLLWTFGALWTNPKKLHLLNVYPKLKQQYQKHVKNTIFINTFNLTDNHLLHIQSGKIHQRRGICFATSMRWGVCLASSSFITSYSHANCMMIMICQTTSIVKTLVDQLVCLEILVRNEILS